jgi:aryl-alcohol dehydrogenase-like predicted oxidoreductase
MLIGEALKGIARERFLVSVKFGAMRDPAGGWSSYDGRPDAVKNFLAYSLRRLGLDYIDIYRPARLDPHVPIEETVGAIADMVSAGYVRCIGLSEMGVDTIRRAAATHPISDLQIEYSLISRGIEDAILPLVRDLGLGITAYGVLSRGLISGHWNKGTLAPGDLRAHGPRFQDGNVDQNSRWWKRCERSPTRGASAWRSWRSPGWRRKAGEAVGALKLSLSADDLATIGRAVPKGAATGERYSAAQTAHLDSEKR